VVGWVLFRAESWEGSMAILSGMAGLNGFALNVAAPDINWKNVYGILAGLMIVVWTMPNTYQIMSRYRPTLKDERLPLDPAWKPLDYKWRPSALSAYITAGVAIAALSMLTRVSEFLYYQF